MIRSLVLDISKHLQPATQTMILRQGDKESLTLSIAVNEDEEAFDLTDYEARFMAQLQDGKVIIDPCEKDGANMLSYTLPSALTAKAGNVALSYIAIYRGDEWVASTEAMAFCILPGVDISAEEAESLISEFLALKAQFEDLLAEADDQRKQQQESWETQMEAQQEEFEEQEALRDAAEALREEKVAQALETLDPLTITSIADAEIDALWVEAIGG